MNADQQLRVEAAKLATAYCSTHGGSVASVARGIYDFLSEEPNEPDVDPDDFEIPPEVQEIFDMAKKRVEVFNSWIDGFIRSVSDTSRGKNDPT